MKNVITRIVAFVRRIPPVYAFFAVAISGAALYANAKIEERDDRIRTAISARASADSAQAIVALRDSLSRAYSEQLAQQQSRADSVAQVSKAQAQKAITRWNRLRDSLRALPSDTARLDSTETAQAIETADEAVQYCSYALNDCEKARQVADSVIAFERQDKARIAQERDSAQVRLATPREPEKKTTSKLRRAGRVIGAAALGLLGGLLWR